MRHREPCLCRLTTPSLGAAGNPPSAASVLHDPHRVRKWATVRRSETVSSEEKCQRANHDSLLTHTATYCWLVASQQKWKSFRNVIFAVLLSHTQQQQQQQQQSTSETNSCLFFGRNVSHKQILEVLMSSESNNEPSVVFFLKPINFVSVIIQCICFIL